MSFVPNVNINGDSIETLISQHHHVVLAARQLSYELASAAPHGRNYQCNPPHDYKEARETWEQLLSDTRAIMRWAEEILHELLKQNIQRNGSRAYAIAAKAMEHQSVGCKEGRT